MRMNRSLFIIAFVLLGLLIPLPVALAQSVEFSGYVRNYTGVLADEDNEYAISQNTFDLKLEHRGSNVSVKANPYLYTFHDKENQMDLRQAFIDIFFDAVDIRVGKQQIVWGKADGVFITDIVSPKNLSEFMLPDFEEIRIGVEALKMTAYFGDNALELVWIPVFTPTVMPGEGSIWYIEPEFPLDHEFDTSNSEVENKVSNSEVFVKFSRISSAIDFELMAGHMWDDNPTLHIYRVIDPITNQPKLKIVPEHHRLDVGGISFSSTVAGAVVRGEAAYYAGKYFQTEDPEQEDHVTVKDYIHYLLGFDFSLLGIDLSLQLIQQQIVDYDEYIVQDKEDNTATLRLRKDFLRETLTTELLCYVNTNNEDALYRPKLTYDISDSLEFQIGANIFIGEKGTYGQYSQNDNGYTKLKYSF